MAEKEAFIEYICDYVKFNFKYGGDTAFSYRISFQEWFVVDWDSVEKDLKDEILNKTNLDFDVVFDRENLQIRGRLIREC